MLCKFKLNSPKNMRQVEYCLENGVCVCVCVCVSGGGGGYGKLFLKWGGS